MSILARLKLQAEARERLLRDDIAATRKEMGEILQNMEELEAIYQSVLKQVDLQK